MEKFELILPPHWHKRGDGNGYYNDLTNETSDSNPINKFFQFRSKYFTDSEENTHLPPEYKYANNSNTVSAPSPHYIPFSSDHDEISNVSGDFQELERTTDNTVVIECKGKSYDYKCQWNERDCNGKVSLYGLTVRFYEDNSTLIKFDGIDGEWVYSALQGTHGPITHHDLFIGARLVIFGRHLTVSSANAASIRWSEKEFKRLNQQQEAFRKRILSVGHIPCSRLKEPDTVRHITRNEKSAANHDLRKVLIETGKLGEQLVALGLAPAM
jgi:hypothetical protein